MSGVEHHLDDTFNIAIRGNRCRDIHPANKQRISCVE
jgi:hypothetical protein